MSNLFRNQTSKIHFTCTLHPDLFCSNGIHSISAAPQDLDESVCLQNVDLSNFLCEMVDEVSARISGSSNPIHKRCCSVGEKLSAYKQQFVSRYKPTNYEAVVFVLDSLKVLRNEFLVKYLFLSQDIQDGISKAQMNTSWDSRFLMRWNKFFTKFKTKIIVGKNLESIQDPISGIFLPIYDPTKETINSLKNFDISFVVIDIPCVENWKLKFLKSIFEYGNWGKLGKYHNLIVPLFKENVWDPTLLAFSAYVIDSDIFLGEVAQRAFCVIIWHRMLELVEYMLFSSIELKNYHFKNKTCFDNINSFLNNENPFYSVSSYLFQLISLWPFAMRDNAIVFIAFELLSNIAAYLRLPEVISTYISSLVLHGGELEHNGEHPLSKTDDKTAGNIKLLYHLNECHLVVRILFPFVWPNSVNNWLSIQISIALEEWLLAAYGVFLEECDFDIESPLSTVYQWKAESNMYIKKSVNLVECFNSIEFGKWIPIQNGYFIYMAEFQKHILCESYTYSLRFISAALRLTLNQVFYSNACEYLPVGIGLFSIRKKKGIWSSVISILVKLYRFSTCKNRFVTLYLLEILNQIIRPLMQCNLCKNEICPEVISLWEPLKMYFCLPQPVTIQTRSTEVYSIPQILEKRWTHIPQKPRKLNSPDSYNSSIQKYITLNELMEICTKFLKTFENNNDKCISRPVNFGALFGTLRFADKLPNNTDRPIDMFGATKVYTEEIRTSLHIQFALYFLTPEAFKKHFEELQENAWKCHPLYSPDFGSFRPPHCTIPERSNDTNAGLESTRSTERVSAVGQTSENTSNPSSLITTLGLENSGRRLPGFGGPLANDLPSYEQFRNVRNADPSETNQQSYISSVAPNPEYDPEELKLPIVEQRLTYDPYMEGEQHVEHEHNGAEGRNVRNIALDSHKADLDIQQRVEHEHNEAEAGNNSINSNEEATELRNDINSYYFK